MKLYLLERKYDHNVRIVYCTIERFTQYVSYTNRFTGRYVTHRTSYILNKDVQLMVLELC